jgi:carboxylate-amine ligase
MPPKSPIAQRDKPVLDLAALRERCAAAPALWIGLEEELMVLDVETLDLEPRAPQLLARLHGDPRFKLEMPAAQIEIATTPEAGVVAAADQLALARAELAAAAAPDLRLASAGVHPFAAPRGVLNGGERFDETRREFGEVAERQLVFGLHVHVAVGDADAAVPIHDALRSFLPEIAALAANAPFHDGADTGLASIRPAIIDALPRQGVPPAIGSLEAYASALQWGARSGAVPHPRRWWWGLRVHPEYGTVEVRVPDAQATVAETAAIASVVQALVAALVARRDEGGPLAVAPGWRIEENRRSAARFGVAGEMADLDSGEREPTAERLLRLLDDVAPHARRLGCDAALATARAMLAAGGPAAAQRRVAARGGLRDVVGWLADRYGAA